MFFETNQVALSMNRFVPFPPRSLPPLTRRAFLTRTGLGFGGLALGTLLARDGFGTEDSWRPPTGLPHFAPTARSVIWIFLRGGLSHVESFDPKPALNRYEGKSIS